MSKYDLRDYYKRQEAQAALLMVAQPEGLQKQSAEEAFDYFRTLYYHYNALCSESKP